MVSVLIVLVILVVILSFVTAWLKKRSEENRRDADEAIFQFTSLSNEVEQKAEERRATARRRYVTKAMKQHVLERDEYTCQICGISKGLLDRLIPGLGEFLLLEIDHITPVAKGGSGDDEKNLQTLCWRCNRKKGKNKTNEEVKEIIDYGADFLHRCDSSE